MSGIGLSMRLSPTLTQEVSHRLTLGQKLQIKAAILGMRLDLIGSIHGGNYQPHAVCPTCARAMTAMEIIAGFRDDPNDYTTSCTFCNKRFEPKLLYRMGEDRAELPFYCATQVLAQLHGLETLKPEEIQKNHQAIYHSVRVHHGNFRIAFQQLGVQYAYETITNWKEKVQGFLGKLPDTTIAEVVDLPVSTVRTLRNSLGIPTFSRRRLLEELEQQ